MEQSDFCVVASRIEPVSAVTVEAMIRKKPCIVTDVCGVARYLTDGEDALFCPAEDAEALAKAITSAVQIYRADDSRYEAMGSSARGVYERTFLPAVFRESVLRLLPQPL